MPALRMSASSRAEPRMIQMDSKRLIRCLLDHGYKDYLHRVFGWFDCIPYRQREIFRVENYYVLQYTQVAGAQWPNQVIQVTQPLMSCTKNIFSMAHVMGWSSKYLSNDDDVIVHEAQLIHNLRMHA